MKTIRTPYIITLDPRRYHLVREIEPVQTMQGLSAPVEITMDYDRLAADLDVMGWPDELTEAIGKLATNPPAKVAVSIRTGDLIASTSQSIVRQHHPDAFCMPDEVLESMPPRVKSWRVFDSNNRWLGASASTESGAWDAAHDHLNNK